MMKVWWFCSHVMSCHITESTWSFVTVISSTLLLAWSLVLASGLLVYGTCDLGPKLPARTRLDVTALHWATCTWKENILWEFCDWAVPVDWVSQSVSVVYSLSRYSLRCNRHPSRLTLTFVSFVCICHHLICLLLYYTCTVLSIYSTYIYYFFSESINPLI